MHWLLPFSVAVVPAFSLCDSPSTSEKIRGHYENKIRFFAAPEKIYETFASIKSDDGVFMSYKDFFHTLTPYSFIAANEDEEDNYFDRFKPEILKLADVNQDG